jgi:hypothetical protein
MSSFYVPYTGKKPATTVVNGHRLVILFDDKEAVESNLEHFGADSIKKFSVKRGIKEDVVLERIAKRANAGVVVAPGSVQLSEILHNLEAQLPWIQ